MLPVVSRNAEVIVLAHFTDEAMAPLTERDGEREWSGEFAHLGGTFYGWFVEVVRRVRPRPPAVGPVPAPGVAPGRTRRACGC